VYGGVIVPLVTPLTAEGEVCAASVEQLIESVRSDVTGLMPALSSGEGWRLKPWQWRDMVLWTCRFARGLPVLAGIELPTTSEVSERAVLARQLEVDAIVVAPPFVADLSQEQIRAHYQTIRSEAGLPVFLYNEPKLTGAPMTLDTLIALCRSEGVVGIKDSSGSAGLARELVAARTGAPVFQGFEHLCAATQGVAGYVLPLANLDPGLCRSMLHAPSAALQAEIDRRCVEHALLDDQWYLGLKRELRRRGVISDDRAV
jgi:4-hydroxy-tetrahydrodipicolinate synthase